MSSLPTILIACMSVLFVAQTHASEVQREQYEPAVQAIIQTIREGDLDAALSLVDLHIADFPKSRIGYLLKADTLEAMSSEFNEIGKKLASQPRTQSGLKHQLRNRWQHINEDSELAARFVPASLVYMGRHEYALVNDMQAGRLYLYRNVDDRPVLVRDYYLTIGSAGFGKRVEGDNKTPVGVYSINQFIHTRELPDLYGDGAFPVDYPNRLDRSKNRTGYGIWLHGTPSETYARAPWASRGCFVVSNDDFNDVKPFINVKRRTPVILSDGVDWIDQAELEAQRKQLTEFLEAWQRDIADLDTDAYLNHYASNAHNFGTKLKPSWDSGRDYYTKPKLIPKPAPLELPTDVKTLPPTQNVVSVTLQGVVNPITVKPELDQPVENSPEVKPIEVQPPAVKPAKSSIRTTIESIFAYPSEPDMFVVQSKLKLKKGEEIEWLNLEHYWQRNDNGQWQILYEGRRG